MQRILVFSTQKSHEMILFYLKLRLATTTEKFCNIDQDFFTVFL